MHKLLPRWRAFRSFRRESGQSMVETALMAPILVGLAFNALNLGYFWYMVLTLSAIPRQGVQYASQGGQAIAATSAPSASLIETMVYENLTGAIKATSANAYVQVCTYGAGTTGTGSTQKSICTAYGSTTPTYTPTAVTSDPEAPLFVLNRVTVVYTVTPLIPGGAFNVLLPTNMQFKRQVSMRNLY